MKATAKKEIVIILELTVEEAHWLKNKQQNPPSDDIEEHLDKVRRECIFEELKRVLQ